MSDRPCGSASDIHAEHIRKDICHMLRVNPLVRSGVMFETVHADSVPLDLRSDRRSTDDIAFILQRSDDSIDCFGDELLAHERAPIMYQWRPKSNRIKVSPLTSKRTLVDRV